jgi:hypothetical protein
MCNERASRGLAPLFLHTSSNTIPMPLYSRVRDLIPIVYKYFSGKAHPRTGHEGPEEEEKYSSTPPLTSALDGVGGQRHAPAALPPRKDPVHNVQEAG